MPERSSEHWLVNFAYDQVLEGELIRILIIIAEPRAWCVTLLEDLRVLSAGMLKWYKELIKIVTDHILILDHKLKNNPQSDVLLERGSTATLQFM